MPWLALLAALAAPRSNAASSPNIVVINADDAGYAEFGFMQALTGVATEFQTPRLDQLASQSVIFSNAYSTSPVCSVSRAGLLTGRNASHFGMEYQIADSQNEHDGIPSSEPLLSETLQQLGYATGAVGKWHLGEAASKRPNARGFDEFYGFLSGGRHYYGIETIDGNKIRRGDTVVDWTAEPSFLGAPPDPIRGRYLTDAFGDEASQFIANHASNTAPFFLYVPLTAPHGPYEAKQQDLAALNATTLTGQTKTIAAQVLALDRAVGNILDRLDDPNGDGDQGDSIADSTIVVFTNDNGGTDNQDNGVLRGVKGYAWEGGIRVPMLMRAPGVVPQRFDEMVSTLDLAPSLVNAASGTASPTRDGVDLFPFLQGTQEGAVHDALYWRGGVNYWAIRQGDWKLTKPSATGNVELYHLQPDGAGEYVDLSSSNPEKFAELLHKFVDWEVTLPRPSESTARPFNRFDRFLYSAPDDGVWPWRASGIWRNADEPSQVVNLYREDPYANLVLVFNPRDNVDFTTNNNLARAAAVYYPILEDPAANVPDGLREVVLNQLRFEGSFGGNVAREGVLTGLPLLFTASLSGELPELVLASERTTSSDYTFRIDLDLLLHDDLQIVGDSDVHYLVNGDLREFGRSRSIFKTGSSAITLAGQNTLHGTVAISEGLLRIDGDGATLVGPTKIDVSRQARMALARGSIDVDQISIRNMGQFDFLGGSLKVDLIDGDLVNQGGTFIVPDEANGTVVIGNLSQQDGASLALKLGEKKGDYLTIFGDFAAGGDLVVTLESGFTPQLGDRFQLIDALSFTGGFFSTVLPPDLSSEIYWDTSQLNDLGQLSLWTYADANQDDGAVDQIDLDVILSQIGSVASTIGSPTTNGDANRDGKVDGLDMLVWQRHAFAQRAPNLPIFTQVPEPNAVALSTLSAASLFAGSRPALSRVRRKPMHFA